MPLPFGHCGGLFYYATQLIRPSRESMNAMGSVGNQALFNLVLARWLSVDGEPVSGVFGDDLQVAIDAADVVVAPGVAMLYDAGADDPYDLLYRPVVLEEETSLSLAPPHATETRIDVVSVAPTMVEDTEAQVWVRGSGILNPHMLPTRKRFSSLVEITQGVPGAGPPATPAGHLKLAEIHVAPGLPVEVLDCRPILNVSAGIRPVPGEDHVVTGMSWSRGTEGVTVREGVYQIDGYRFRHSGAQLPVAENTTGSTRYDLLVAKANGAVELLIGDAGLPTADDAPAGTLALAWFAVDDDSLIVDSGDLRETGTIGHAQMRGGAVSTRAIQDKAVTAEKLADDAVSGVNIEPGSVTVKKLHPNLFSRGLFGVRLVHLSYNSATRQHVFEAQMVDADFEPIGAMMTFNCTLRDHNWDPSGVTGMALDADSKVGAGTQILAHSDVTGKALIRVNVDPGKPTSIHHLEVQPIGDGGGVFSIRLGGGGGAWLAFTTTAGP